MHLGTTHDEVEAKHLDYYGTFVSPLRSTSVCKPSQTRPVFQSHCLQHRHELCSNSLVGTISARTQELSVDPCRSPSFCFRVEELIRPLKLDQRAVHAGPCPLFRAQNIFERNQARSRQIRGLGHPLAITSTTPADANVVKNVLVTSR